MEIYNLKDPIPEGNLTNKRKRDLTNDDTPLTATSFQVTNIKQGVKNPNRANIFINNKYSFSLDIAQVVDFKLKIGQTLTLCQLRDYKSASEYGKLYQRALEWVLIRPRSIRETKDYLRRKIRSSYEGSPEPGKAESSAGYPWQRAGQTRPEEDVSNFPKDERTREEYFDFSKQIIARLIKKGYLDDQKFAEYYVENRFVKKGISKKRLRMELIKKGIANDIIDQVLDARNDEEEIKKIIAKKRAKYDDDKLINYLVRQGFSYQLAQTLVRETD